MAPVAWEKIPVTLAAQALLGSVIHNAVKALTVPNRTEEKIKKAIADCNAPEDKKQLALAIIATLRSGSGATATSSSGGGGAASASSASGGTSNLSGSLGAATGTPSPSAPSTTQTPSQVGNVVPSTPQQAVVNPFGNLSTMTPNGTQGPLLDFNNPNSFFDDIRLLESAKEFPESCKILWDKGVKTASHAANLSSDTKKRLWDNVSGDTFTLGLGADNICKEAGERALGRQKSRTTASIFKKKLDEDGQIFYAGVCLDRAAELKRAIEGKSAFSLDSVQSDQKQLLSKNCEKSALFKLLYLVDALDRRTMNSITKKVDTGCWMHISAAIISSKGLLACDSVFLDAQTMEGDAGSISRALTMAITQELITVPTPQVKQTYNPRIQRTGTEFFGQGGKEPYHPRDGSGKGGGDRKRTKDGSKEGGKGTTGKDLDTGKGDAPWKGETYRPICFNFLEGTCTFSGKHRTGKGNKEVEHIAKEDLTPAEDAWVRRMGCVPV